MKGQGNNVIYGIAIIITVVLLVLWEIREWLDEILLVLGFFVMLGAIWFIWRRHNENKRKTIVRSETNETKQAS